MKGMEAMAELGYYHRDIQPSNIRVTNAGHISLIDYHCFDPHNDSGYKKMMNSHLYFSPLSPQQLKNYVRRVNNAEENVAKNEMFSLGMTILSVSTLTHLKDFYDLVYGNISLDLIESKLQKMKQLTYSDYLVKTVRNLVSTSEHERPTVKELMDFLKPSREGTTSKY